MSDIAPLRAAVAVSATAAPGAVNATAALATIAGGAVPTALTQLGVGAVITGVVAERGPRGQVIMRTDKGSLTLQTALALRVGAAITVQIQSLGAQSQMMILSVDGQPLANQQAGAIAKQAPASPLNTPSLSPSADKTSLAASAPAARPATTPPSPAAAPQALRAGAVLTGLLMPQSPVPGSSPASTPVTAPPLVARGGEDSISVRILGITPPRPAPALTPDPSPPRSSLAPAAADAVTFTATVIEAGSDEAGGSTLLRTPFGMVRLPVPAHEPAGSQIALELLTPRDGTSPRIASIGHELGTPRQILALGQEWPALRNLVAALETEAPELAQQILATTVPRVGPTLAAGMLLFVGAMRNGNLRSWLGEQTIDALERRGHGGLVKQLADDMAVLPRLAETQENGWQTLLLPVFDGEALRQIRMSLRRSRKDEKGERKDGARFIIEAELSKLGPLQLDGLVRMPQFDLAVRTRENMPPDLRANIVEIFNDALQATGMKGAVTFQVSRDFRPGPFENWQASGQGVTV